ncbi:hypothetical protein Rsub_04837 [Raphidocelis subcapitata]|uniref:Uncharacterized protein n=1 Tax=Raphidocelis subcapitata TaxID=307507 RepID=A0A2V0NU29_9CHLO|nr:hypothetical protein Rsub_04837 [Raphidocelis subcapitata]|eukprot:GBF91168.1 hypothetical protein Rsub_04837 [Raphidocelis subcapitata]
MEATASPGTASRRTSLAAGEGKQAPQAQPLLHVLCNALVERLEEGGVATRQGEQIVGGVALAQPYYAAALYSEGRAPDAPAPFHAALFSRGGPGPVFATREELDAGAPRLPRDSPVLARALSALDAVRSLHWGRPPAVLLFGLVAAGEAALDRCEAAGLPVSPSLAPGGAHPEELATQLLVFLRAFRYPEHDAFVLADWGFLVCGDDVEGAAAAYDARIHTALLGHAAGPADGAHAAPGVLRRARGMLRSSSAGARHGAAAAAVQAPSASPPHPAQQPRGGGGGAGQQHPEGPSPMSDALRATRAAHACGAAPACGRIGEEAGAHGEARAAQRAVPAFHTGLRPW